MKRIVTYFSIALVTIACTKAGNGTVSIKQDKIEAGAAKANYTVEVVADCSWTAVLEDENGDAPVWATLSKSKGNGNGQIDIRVYENQYNVERKSNLKVTADAGNTSAVIPVIQASAGGGETVSVDLRLGTYNLRMSNLDNDDADNKWDVRKSRLKQSITDNAFDVFAVEEVSSAQQTWLRTEFGDRYDCYFFSPYATSGSGDKAHGILYRKGQFTISGSHFFWMGDNPHTMSTSDTGSQGNFNRGGCCAVFTHKASSVKFFFMATHACLNADPNDKYAYIYEDMEKEYNAEHLPSFFTGDMNARTTTKAYSEWSGYWKDSYLAADTKLGAANTFNGFKSATGSSRVDYIFYRGTGIKAKTYNCNNTRYNNLYASDHFPVTLDCTITVNKQ